MDNDDIFFHLGEGSLSSDIGASPPIFESSHFTFKTVDDMSRSLAHEDDIPFYTRGANPTVQILQEKLAALEGTDRAMVFSSGSAAISAAIISQVKAGDHIVCIENPYSWTKKLISNILNKFSVSYTFISADNSQAIVDACQPETTLIYLESPNSWTYEMQDLELITTLARKKGITTILDNSCATPLLQQPHQYGIDIIVHSATKYLSGHADVICGVLCCSEHHFLEIFKNEFMALGAIISPLEAWLMIRSLRTLELRLKAIGENALQVGAFLEDHPKIEKLFFTHSEKFEQPELVSKYLKGNGGLMTIDLKSNNEDAIKQFCNTLQRFKLGCSWGGYESLAFPALTTKGSLNYDSTEVKINRIRLFIGLENPDLLISDLANALEKI